MAKHWLIDAVTGPLELQPFPLDLTDAEVMIDLGVQWAVDGHVPTEDAATVRAVAA